MQQLFLVSLLECGATIFFPAINHFLLRSTAGRAFPGRVNLQWFSAVGDTWTVCGTATLMSSRPLLHRSNVGLTFLYVMLLPDQFYHTYCRDRTQRTLLNELIKKTTLYQFQHQNNLLQVTAKCLPNYILRLSPHRTRNVQRSSEHRTAEADNELYGPSCEALVCQTWDTRTKITDHFHKCIEYSLQCTAGPGRLQTCPDAGINPAAGLVMKNKVQWQ